MGSSRDGGTLRGAREGRSAWASDTRNQPRRGGQCRVGTFSERRECVRYLTDERVAGSMPRGEGRRERVGRETERRRKTRRSALIGSYARRAGRARG